MVKIIKITRIVNLVYSSQLFKLSSWVRAAMAVAAVSKPNPSSAECKDAENLPGTTGVTV
jgi:hypothetical protein